MPRTLPQVGEHCQGYQPQKGERLATALLLTIPGMGNNLRQLREDKGWTHQEAADAMGVSRGQFIKLERGGRRLNSEYIRLAAQSFGVSDSAVIATAPPVPVVGYVGAGAEAHLYSVADRPDDEAPAIEGAKDTTVAVEIRGGSLGPLFDRWLAYYDDVRRPVTEDLLGKLCVVGLEDGRVLLKKVAPGRVRGYFDLWSNNEPPIHDVAIAWAAKVEAIRPR